MSEIIDETGNRYGRLTVLSLYPRRIDSNAIWRCRCDCGNGEHLAAGVLLRRGSVRSCGCLVAVAANKAKLPPPNRIGKRYGRLTVTALVGRRPLRWMCRCACGKENVVVRSSNLTTGYTKSCGCKRFGRKGVRWCALCKSEAHRGPACPLRPAYRDKAGRLVGRGLSFAAAGRRLEIDGHIVAQLIRERDHG